ncbi:transposase-like protein [Anoxybacillus mongoliensis]|uniref:Transposase-like protein n=1 Tax=Anoxybacillus mongoliensis TaxID=452565 RepID=A0A7W8JFP9_9BACL|nr:transposase-like protein [Anoxybacillus mongoliensis]
MTRRFDKEFKIHAVKLVVEEGKAVAQTARQLDISPKTLHKWVADYKKMQNIVLSEVETSNQKVKKSANSKNASVTLRRKTRF